MTAVASGNLSAAGGGWYGAGGGGGGYAYTTTSTPGIYTTGPWYPTTTPYILPQPWDVTTNPVVTPFPPGVNPADGLLAPRGISKITPSQLNRLLREHTFVEMDTCDFCLFCYALDQFRTRADHIFVISEE